MFFKTIAFIGFAVAAINAQSSTTSHASLSSKASSTTQSASGASSANGTSTSTSPSTTTSATYGFTPCITQCLTAGASAAGCSTYFDLQCTCLSSTFNNTVNSCLQANCTAAEQAQNSQSQTQGCAFVTAAGLSTSITGPHSSSGAIEIGFTGVLWGGIVLAGAAVGAGLAL